MMPQFLVEKEIHQILYYRASVDDLISQAKTSTSSKVQLILKPEAKHN